MASLTDQRADFRQQLRHVLRDKVAYQLILALYDSMSFNIDEAIKEIKNDLSETKQKLDDTSSDLKFVTTRLDILGELTTVTIGVNLAMQLMTYAEENMGTRQTGESMITFQRRCGVVAFVSRNLNRQSDLVFEKDLSDLRLSRNDRVHGLLPIIRTLLKYRSQVNLMTALRLENAFAASIIDNASPFVFFALAGEVVHFCKKQLLPDYAVWSGRASKKCIQALHTQIGDEIASCTESRLMTVFDRFETRYSSGKRVTLEQCMDRQELLQSITDWTTAVRSSIPRGSLVSPGVAEVDMIINNASSLLFRSAECGPVETAGPLLRRRRFRLTDRSTNAASSILRVFRSR